LARAATVHVGGVHSSCRLSLNVFSQDPPPAGSNAVDEISATRSSVSAPSGNVTSIGCTSKVGGGVLSMDTTISTTCPGSTNLPPGDST
jgi:hypothetical protein